MKRINSTLVLACAATAAALAWSVSGPAQPASSASSAASVAAESPGYAVEDFAYPNADRIFQERGILLKRGDGHITLAECGSQDGLLEIWSRSNSRVCFRVTGDSGYLALEIPAVYGVKTNNYDTELTMTVEDEEKSVDVPKNTYRAVGETDDPLGRRHMLVEISTAK